MVADTHDLQATIEEVRDHFADFEDFWRPIRNYLYWEPHCLRYSRLLGVPSLI